jgi:hypothetical protein
MTGKKSIDWKKMQLPKDTKETHWKEDTG